MAQSRPPDLRLAVTVNKEPGDRENSVWHQAGAAWFNDGGSISIKLNAGITLRWDDNLAIYLFPAEVRAGRPRQDKIGREDGEMTPIPGYSCAECGADVYTTRSGTTCTNGHGGADIKKNDMPF